MQHSIRSNTPNHALKSNAKMKSSVHSKIATVHIPTWLQAICWLLVAGVFVVAPYWNGLYFYNDFLPVSIAISLVAVIAGIWLWTSRTEIVVSDFWKSFIPYFLGIGLIYILDMMFAPAQKDLAVEGVVRYIALFGVVFLLSVLLQTPKARKVFLGLIVLMGTWTSVFALANGYGTLHSPGALMQPDNRLASVFQYANTNAAFTVVFLIIAFLYPLLLKNKWLKAVVSIGTYVMLLNMTLTYSRGSWLTFAVMAVILVIFVPKAIRGVVLYTNLAPFLMFAGTLTLQTKAVLTSHPALGWTSLGAGIAAAVVISFAIQVWLEKTNGSLPKMIKYAMVAVLILGLGFIGVKLVQHGVHNSILQRIKEINFQDHSVQERFIYYEDGLKMALAHPVLGDGFGTWQALFQKYQYFPYWSKHEHSYWIELAVETGFVGLILFVAAVVFYFRSIFQSLKHSANVSVVNNENIESQNENVTSVVNHDGKIITLISLFSLVAMVLHSAIDFDMSYGLMNFLFWGMMVVGVQNIKIAQTGNALRAQPLRASTVVYYCIGIAATGLCLLVSVTAFAANHYYSFLNATKGNPNTSLMMVDNASSLASYNSQYALAEAQINDQVYGMTKKVTYGQNAIKYAEKAAALAPNDPSTLMQASQILYKYGQANLALQNSEKAYQNGIFGSKYAEQYMIYLAFQSEENLKKDPKLAKQDEQKLLDAWQQVQKRMDFVNHLPKSMPPEVPFSITDQMKLRAAEGYLMSGDKNQASNLINSLIATSKDQSIVLTAKMLFNVMVEKHMASGNAYPITQQVSTNPSISHEYQLLQQL
ncbi:O-antigen ligase family protein [Fodinisporobacter ferrooxydans]|uniref:O-antigen ligase family protein n=1 Tax=Fodinisporobacter ferrooxydans TaxID=2901836 RepID=A0ABY4CQK7_9BACL|nr:O-antigen ligase family protein [Alicyclobacillaceae bacterium MYW30-H2]